MADLAESATNRQRGKEAPSISPIAKRHGLSGADLETVEATFKAMCRLHDERRDHIWGYYVRNLARPAWLAREENRRTVLVGNPPWLAYRFMTDAMKDVFQLMAKERKLWAGGNVATHQDLADLFVARSVEQYLAPNGRFGFVMPAGVLTRGQSAGFRSGVFPLNKGGHTLVAFDIAWDISAISHRFFPRTACVIFGRRSDEHSALPNEVEQWSGKLPDPSASWDDVRPALTRTKAERASIEDENQPESHYKARFANGANLYPRLLIVVQPDKAPPLGVGEGRRPIRSHRGIYPKKPWKSMDDLTGVIESQFIHRVLVGESVMPYWQRPPAEAVLPLRKGRMMRDDEIEDYDGLRRWWEQARQLTDEHSKSDLTLDQSIDHYRKLTSQFPIAPVPRGLWSFGDARNCLPGDQRAGNRGTSTQLGCCTVGRRGPLPVHRPQQRGRHEGRGTVHDFRQGRRKAHRLPLMEAADTPLRRQRRTPQEPRRPRRPSRAVRHHLGYQALEGPRDDASENTRAANRE